MQPSQCVSRCLLADTAAEIVEEQDPAANGVSALTTPASSYQFLFACQRDGGLNRIWPDESANDAFGAEDLLSQIHEDTVHG